MFYDHNELLVHYKEWFEKYKEPIEERILSAANSDDPQRAAELAAKMILTDIMPIAIIEMILYNNKKLEERFQTEMEGSGCSGCASNL